MSKTIPNNCKRIKMGFVCVETMTICNNVCRV